MKIMRKITVGYREEVEIPESTHNCKNFSSFTDKMKANYKEVKKINDNQISVYFNGVKYIFTEIIENPEPAKEEWVVSFYNGEELLDMKDEFKEMALANEYAIDRMEDFLEAFIKGDAFITVETFEKYCKVLENPDVLYYKEYDGEIIQTSDKTEINNYLEEWGL